MRYQKKSNSSKYILVLLTSAILLTVGTFFGYQVLKNEEVPVSDPTFSNGTEREVYTSPERNGGVIDTSEENKDEVDISDEENWLQSESGKILLIEPKENAIFTSGSTIRGMAEVDKIHYRLIDNRIGVVSTGRISVVNGRFSGVFEFDSAGTEGRLDIFSTLDSGAETNVIEVPIKLR